MTKVELGRAVGLTARRIAEFENEGEQPPTSTIANLADALGFPVTFFDRAPPAEVSPDVVSFRSFSKLAARKRNGALAAAAIAIEVEAALASRLELPRTDIPDLSALEPEVAAATLRSAWGLGYEPSPNVVHLLEAHGVRVFSIVADCRELDAFTLWNSRTPYVFLATDKTAERGRWDAAHELGHLVLHSGFSPQGRITEQEADAFAAAFLMPDRGVLAEAPRLPSLIDICQHKVIWGVSALAYIRRLHKLAVITDWHYRSLVVEASQAGYRSREGDIEREQSKLLPAALRMLADDGWGPADLAREVGLRIADLRDLMFGLPLVSVPGGGARRSPRRVGHLRAAT